MTQFQVGQRVLVARGQSMYVGQHGVVFSRRASGTIRVTLDSGVIYGFYETNLDLCPESQVSTVPAPVKQNKHAQPDTSAVEAFFKGPSNYAQCPNCRAGKLVPMFSGQELCDQACERNPKPAPERKLYWSVVMTDGSTNYKNGKCALFESKDIADIVGRGRPGRVVIQVEWLLETPPVFEQHPKRSCRFYATGPDEVREVAP